MQKGLIHKRQIIVGGSVDTLGGKNITALQDTGYQVVFASDSNEVQVKCTDSAGTVAIIIDGDMDGFLSHSASLNKHNCKVISPVLILISKFRISAVALALQEGFDEFFAKPVGEEELLSVLKKADKNKKSINQKSIS
jgi:DNA-binding NtrC family response regulator